MTDKEIANFTRMADAFEEEILRLRIENKKLKEIVEEANFAANYHDDDEFSELLAYTEALEDAKDESMATVEVLERELYDARRDLALAQAELRIIKLEHELEYHKSAKWDLHPWND